MKRDIHGYEGVLASTTEKALEGLGLDDADRMKSKIAKLQSKYSAIRADCDAHQDKLSVSAEWRFPRVVQSGAFPASLPN